MEQALFEKIVYNKQQHFSTRIDELLLAYHADLSATNARAKQAETTLIAPATFYRKITKHVHFSIHQVISLTKHLKLNGSQTHALLEEHAASFKLTKVKDYKTGLKGLMAYMGTTPSEVSRSLGLEKDLHSWLYVPSSRMPYIDFMAILELGIKVRVSSTIWKYIKPAVSRICDLHKQSVKWGKEEGSYNFDLLQSEFDAAAEEALKNPISSAIRESRLGAECAKRLGVTNAGFSEGLSRKGDKYLSATDFLKLREVLGYRQQEGQTGSDIKAALADAMNEFRKLYAIDSQSTAPALISAMGKMLGCTDDMLGQIMGHTKVSAGVFMAQYKATGYIADSTRFGSMINFFAKADEALKEKYGVSCLSKKDINRIESLNEQAMKRAKVEERRPNDVKKGPVPKLNFQAMTEKTSAALAKF